MQWVKDAHGAGWALAILLVLIGVSAVDDSLAASNHFSLQSPSIQNNHQAGENPSEQERVQTVDLSGNVVATYVKALEEKIKSGNGTNMEALSFGPNVDSLYVGDEYNYIYEISLHSGEILRQWTLADLGIQSNIDKGIKAMTYSSQTGYFYTALQNKDQVLALKLNTDESIELVDQYQIPRN